jgi:chloramphenicol 3-O phosphotransferase
MQRRQATGWDPGWSVGMPIPAPVRRWQEAVHIPGIYDMEVDTSLLSPEQCAAAIYRRLENGPRGTAFERLAALAGSGD